MENFDDSRRARIGGRVESLDILRGLDIFILVCFGPALHWLAKNTGLIPPLVGGQFDHSQWTGITFWDLIMPLFLFMAGVSMPFSLAKYSGPGVWRRVSKRVALLFFFGMLVQGNLLKFDWNAIKFYSNTLQAIGVGYLIAAIFMLNFKPRGQALATAAIFAACWALLTFGGDFSPDGNFAEFVDNAVLGRFRDGVSLKNGEWVLSPYYRYTWILSSLNFGVTVMLGAFAGHIIKGPLSRGGKAAGLFAFAVALLAAGYALSLQMPIIKKIWSSSFTLASGGWCALFMALFYWIVDCAGFSRPLNWLKIYGMNAIAAYVISHVVNFRSVGESFLFGLKPELGAYYPFALNLAQYAIVFAILLAMYKRKIFLRV
ncbi:MAG: DUF5009 domain-containing protein [Opitutales bacterium]|nr:DUF5009 domain-containing protein [Opitutales bacterium]